MDGDQQRGLGRPEGEAPGPRDALDAPGLAAETEVRLRAPPCRQSSTQNRRPHSPNAAERQSIASPPASSKQ